MKLRRGEWFLAAVILLAAIGWFLLFRSQPLVLIRCGPIITQPQVLAPSALPFFALVLAPDGTVWGLGRWNARGVLNQRDGERSWRSLRRLEVGSNWMTLARASSYVVGIKSDGSLWGWDTFPELQNWPYTNSPAQLAPGTNWTAISACGTHTLALRADGTLWSWGRNTRGEVGDGTTKPSLIPKQIGTNHNWAKIAADVSASFGIQNDGTLWQWGLTNWQKASAGGTAGLPNNSNPQVATVPTRVDEGTNWIGIHSFEGCHYAKDDRGWWRRGMGSQLITSQSIPVLCQVTTNRVTLLNRSPFLVIDSDGNVRSLRFGGSEIPPAINDSGRSDPMAPISTRQDWIAAWAGADTGFALNSDGTLWHWGLVHEPSPTEEILRTIQGVLPRWLAGQPSGTVPDLWVKPWPVARFLTNSPPP